MKIARRPMLPLVAAAPQALAQPRDSLVVGNPVEPPHLAPTAHVAGSIREVVCANLFRGVAPINEQGQPFPGLAAIPPGNLTCAVHLRRGAKVRGGRDMTSAGVACTLGRARGPHSTNAG